MSPFPLFYEYLFPVVGPSYVAGVITRGRAVMVREERLQGSSWWIFGVQPDGLDESGQTEAEASHRFYMALVHVLSDIASEAQTFEAFRAEATRFLEQANPTSESEWESARQAVRQAGEITEPFFARLRQVTTARLGPSTILQLDGDGMQGAMPSPQERPNYNLSDPTEALARAA